MRNNTKPRTIGKTKVRKFSTGTDFVDGGGIDMASGVATSITGQFAGPTANATQLPSQILQTAAQIGQGDSEITKPWAYGLRWAGKGEELGGNIGAMVGGPEGQAIGAGVGLVAGAVYGGINGVNQKHKDLNARRDRRRTAFNNEINDAQTDSSTVVRGPVSFAKGVRNLYLGGVSAIGGMQSYGPMLFRSPVMTSGIKNFGKGGKQISSVRKIEIEGREPVFSPPDANGKRQLISYNPSGPTHAEGGVPALVVPNTSMKQKIRTFSNPAVTQTSSTKVATPAKPLMVHGHNEIIAGLSKKAGVKPNDTDPGEKIHDYINSGSATDEEKTAFMKHMKGNMAQTLQKDNNFAKGTKKVRSFGNGVKKC